MKRIALSVETAVTALAKLLLLLSGAVRASEPALDLTTVAVRVTLFRESGLCAANHRGGAGSTAMPRRAPRQHPSLRARVRATVRTGRVDW